MNHTNPAWFHFAALRFSPSMLAERARELLRAMKVAGVRIPPSNRISSAVALVEELNSEQRLRDA